MLTRPDPTAPAAPAAPVGRASATRLGVVTMLPLVGAYVPFALVIGSAIAEHGASLAGWVGSWLIFGGSAQLAAIRTLDAAGPLAAIVTGIVIHARLLVYSTGLARSWPHQPRWFRILAAALIIDPTFAVAQAHAAECHEPDEQRRHFFGAALTLGFGWSAAIAVGMVVGSRLDGVHIEIVVPLCLLALLGEGLRNRSSQLVVAVAASVALLLGSLPSGSGVLVAVLAGAGTGFIADRARS